VAELGWLVGLVVMLSVGAAVGAVADGDTPAVSVPPSAPNGLRPALGSPGADGDAEAEAEGEGEAVANPDGEACELLPTGAPAATVAPASASSARFDTR
jgi:hypothetical protein